MISFHLFFRCKKTNSATAFSRIKRVGFRTFFLERRIKTLPGYLKSDVRCLKPLTEREEVCQLCFKLYHCHLVRISRKKKKLFSYTPSVLKKTQFLKFKFCPKKTNFYCPAYFQHVKREVLSLKYRLHIYHHYYFFKIIRDILVVFTPH